MFPNLSKDIRRYLKDEKITAREIIYLLFTQGVWAITVYRFGYWVHHYFKIPILSAIFKVISFVGFKLVEITTGISIPFSVEIGEGFYIGHFNGIIINGNVKIGKNCSIGTGVVIGTRGLGDKGAPIIGDNVYIGVGAKVLGGVKIGNNVKIGANAVVLNNIPDEATAVGIPAKVVKIGNKKLIREPEYARSN